MVIVRADLVLGRDVQLQVSGPPGAEVAADLAVVDASVLPPDQVKNIFEVLSYGHHH